MSLIYLDACTIIYIVEAVHPFRKSVIDKIDRFRSGHETRLLTSNLSRLECRVRPLQEDDAVLLRCYEDFFTKRGLLVMDITRQIIDVAADLRARYRFRTPDAVHLATAIDQKADVFLTGDADLVRCTEVNVESL